MAAHSFLRLGRRYFYAVREGYPTEFAAVFRDAERRDTPGPTEDDDTKIEFVVPVRVMRERLDVLGHTAARANAEVNRYCAEEMTIDRPQFESWVGAMVAPVAADDDWPDQPEEPHMWVDGRLMVRLLLDAAPDDQEFALDVTAPVAWGLIDAPPDLCAAAFAEEYAERATYGTLVILTEGSTDAEFLAGALVVRRPHLAPYVRFLDYFSQRPEGGVSALVRAVKAFAAAGITNRVVALFDNDTAAADALRGLDVTALPPNFRVVQLPHLALARSYPTIGPTGETLWDVNGSACSLELYLGRDVLTDDAGALVPVQWAGLANKLGRYQGELVDKRAVQDRYRLKVAAARSAHEPGGDWSDLDTILDSILAT